ncbi:MAG TPA: T9SS type A sorting domain-containing protein, partial [Desulfobacterales bacterium]|nr:T9SS type A sorting domain-containing protein [Desulfobacterales bacterium]
LGKGRLEEIFFLPDGTILRVLANRLEIAEPNTNKTLVTFAKKSRWIGKVTVSADGSRLAIVTNQRSPAQTVVEIWDIASRRKIREWTSQTNFYTTALSSNLTVLAGYSQGDIYLWNMETGEEAGKVEWGQQRGFVLLALSPDGQQLLASHTRLIEDLGGDEIWGLTTEIWDVAARQRLEILDMPTRVLRSSPARVIEAVYSADACWLITADTLNQVTLWNAQSLEKVRTWNTMGEVQQISFSPDNRRVYVAVGGSGSPRKAHRVRVWDVETGKQLHELGDETIYLDGFSISPDEKLAILWYMDGFIALWDIAQERRLAFWTDYVTPSWGVVAPDGRFLVSLGAAALTIWNLQLQSLQKVIFPDKFFRRVAVSPDSQTFAVDQDPWIEIRNIRSGKIIAKIPNNVGSTPFTFSSDGKRLALGEGRGLVIYDIGKPGNPERLTPQVPDANRGGVSIITFSDDNRYLAAADSKEWVQVWEWKMGRYVHRHSWRLAMSSISSLEFEPRRTKPALLTGGDFRMQVWELGEKVPADPAMVLDARAPVQFVRNRRLSLNLFRQGTYLLVNRDKRLQIWDWGAKKPLVFPDIPSYFAVNRDGSVLLTWDWETYQTQIRNIQSLFLPKLVLWGQVKKTALLPNFPNPLNPETWIPYQLGEATHVRIKIYNLSGRLVRTLDLGNQPAGSYLNRQKAVYWDGRNDLGEPVSSGVYFYVLVTGDFRTTRRMSVVR